MLKQVAEGVLIHQSALLESPVDPRIGPSATFSKDWLPGVDEWQRQQLTNRGERDGIPGR